MFKKISGRDLTPYVYVMYQTNKGHALLTLVNRTCQIVVGRNYYWEGAIVYQPIMGCFLAC